MSEPLYEQALRAMLFAVSESVLRLARCRHPRDSVWSVNAHHPHEVCLDCGSVRAEWVSGKWANWIRPKLVADLIAEKKGSGK